MSEDYFDDQDNPIEESPDGLPDDVPEDIPEQIPQEPEPEEPVIDTDQIPETTTVTDEDIPENEVIEESKSVEISESEENLEEEKKEESLDEKAEPPDPGIVRITKITMHGFKSFADKVQVPLPGGFNVVCGPNGSGKSNIIDATCFVLGTLSGKRLRADNFKDLVFKGGKKRTSSKEALVSLHMERERDGEVEQFEITRKINHSGDTQYKLNGKTTTRRKVLDILSELGIQSDGHNIVMQGDVMDIIKMSPEERRGIIDEVAGIAEFDEKKHKANLELNKVEAKLKEAEIILEERRKAMIALEQQKRHATRYKELQDHMKKLSASIFKKSLENKETSMESIESRILDIGQKIRETDERLKVVDDKINQSETEISSLIKTKPSFDNSIAHDISTTRAMLERKIAELDGKRREIGRIDQNIENFKKMSRGRAQDEIMKLNREGVHGVLKNLIFAPDKYRKAIDVALGFRGSDIVVDNDKIAEECISFLKQNKIGRASFIPLNKIVPKKAGLIEGEGVIGEAVNLIGFDPEFGAAVKFALGGTYIVENIDAARAHMNRARMVTLDGDLIERSGLMRGGHSAKKKGFDVDPLLKDKEALEGEIKPYEKEIDKLREKLSSLENKGKDQSSSLEKKLTDIESRKNKLRIDKEKIFQKKMDLKERQQDLELKKASYNAEVQGIKESMQEFEDIDEYYDKDISVLKSEQVKARQELMKLGSPNLRALEEYELVNKVYLDLKNRVETIRKEKDTVLNMVMRIEERRTTTFMEAFTVINKNFTDIFLDLMEGGKASIRLEEEDNIESGLLIKARPKGKREINIDAMSGGEKTVTALAFLFSVLMYKGAPFYLMDEIDAALDKKNARKISKLIERFSKKSQFIVVTHNESTISLAHRVYGVSMEDGVSKMMSIKMPENT